MGKRLLVPISEEIVLALERAAEREGVPLRMLVERLLRASLMVLDQGWSSDVLFLLEALRSIGASPVPLTLLDEIGGPEAEARAREVGREVAEAAAQIGLVNNNLHHDTIELLLSLTRYVYPQARPLKRDCSLIVPLTGLGDISKAYISGFLEGFAEYMKCSTRITKLAITIDCCSSRP